MGGAAADVHVRRLPYPADLRAAVGDGGGVFTVRGWQVFVADALRVVADVADLDWLGDVCAWRAPRDPGLPPFVGGAAGYLSDDLSPALLGLAPDARAAVSPLGPLWLGLYDAAACIPPTGEETWLVTADLPGLSTHSPRARLDALAARLRPGSPRAQAPQAGARAVPSMSADTHADAVARTLQWIAAGELYQLNLTFQVRAPWSAGGALLSERLTRATPGAAHAAYLQVGDVAIVSVSPETFLRVDGDVVVTRPIKGTRPRDDDPVEDSRQAQALVRSAKDRAEHVMIVDLERNDLGRVCQTGTVAVPELAAVEPYPTVWHLTSTVRGTLHADVGLGALVAATFPPGSVTGAPKRAAAAGIRRLEPVRRGVYCGAIGVVSRGLVDLSVAIRTAVVHDGVASYGAGGGIVADSQAADEYAEALAKARAFTAALGADAAGPDVPAPLGGDAARPDMPAPVRPGLQRAGARRAPGR